MEAVWPPLGLPRWPWGGMFPEVRASRAHPLESTSSGLTLGGMFPKSGPPCAPPPKFTSSGLALGRDVPGSQGPPRPPPCVHQQWPGPVAETVRTTLPVCGS